MKISLELGNFRWVPVYTIKKGTELVKGRSELYRETRAAAAAINHRLVCYSWGSEEKVFYCGSIARNYKRGGFHSNLEGRVHNYLTNHRVKENGRINTNKMVFDHIVSELPNKDITLSILVFDQILLGGKLITFEEYSNNPDLIHAVEQLMICSYKMDGQSQWNRTPSSVPIQPTIEVQNREPGEPQTAESIRVYVLHEFVNPAMAKGQRSFTVRAGDVHTGLGLDARMPSVCQVLDGQKFLEFANVSLLTRSGPNRGSNAQWEFLINNS